MVNLALYSDQVIPQNAAVDARLMDLMKTQGVGTRLGYIPSGPEPDRYFFNDRKRYYARLGLDLALYHDLDGPHGSAETAALFGCDAIHLSGGDTSAFLGRMKRHAMLAPLRDWAMKGGILIGTSAGAILMTPTIATDALFAGRKPEEMADGDALDLLPFEFFPHLNDDAAYLPQLVRYSRHTARPIVACNDGDGIVVSNGVVEWIGSPLWISDGVVEHAAQIAFPAISSGMRD